MIGELTISETGPAAALVVAWAVVKAFAEIVLLKVPAPFATTFTLKLQLPGDWEEVPAGTIPPVKDTALAPGKAVTVPPQVLLIAGTCAMDRPGGRLSIN